MNFSININAAQNLFLMLYALCVAATISLILPSMFNYGVGIIFKEKFKIFFIRALFMGIFFFLSSITFVLGFYFIENNSASGFFSTVLYVFVIIILSMSPWFCDHLARLILFPARKIIELREKEFKYVDIVFVSIYLFLLSCLLIIWKLIG
jgi:hypothetical protein